MNPSESRSKLPLWVFFVADAVLVGTAVLIAQRSAAPLSAQAMWAIAGLVLAGAFVGLVPLILRYERIKNEQLDDRQRALEALAQTVSASAEQISIAAGSLNGIAELAARNLKLAEQLPHKLQDKIAEFRAQAADLTDGEKEEMEKELNALRSTETERLETVSDKLARAAAELARLEAATREHVATANEATAKLALGTASAIGKAQAAAEQALGQARVEAAKSLGESAGQGTKSVEAARAAALADLDAHFARHLSAIDEKLAQLSAATGAATASPAAAGEAEGATAGTARGGTGLGRGGSMGAAAPLAVGAMPPPVEAGGVGATGLAAAAAPLAAGAAGGAEGAKISAKGSVGARLTEEGQSGAALGAAPVPRARPAVPRTEAGPIPSLGLAAGAAVFPPPSAQENGTLPVPVVAVDPAAAGVPTPELGGAMAGQPAGAASAAAGASGADRGPSAAVAGGAAGVPVPTPEPLQAAGASAPVAASASARASASAAESPAPRKARRARAAQDVGAGAGADAGTVAPGGAGQAGAISGRSGDALAATGVASGAEEPRPVSGAAIPEVVPVAPLTAAPFASGKAVAGAAARKAAVADEEPSLGLDLSDSAPEAMGAVEATSLTSDGATRLLVTAYIGIGNRLFLRGEGPGLSWEKGVPLQFISIGKWRWETNEAAGPVRFKLFKNDASECTALGAQTIAPGHQQEVTAAF